MKAVGIADTKKRSRKNLVEQKKEAMLRVFFFGGDEKKMVF